MFINNPIYKTIVRLREQATNQTAQVMDVNDADFASIEADNFEVLLGNYLITFPLIFNTIKNNSDYAEEFGDLLNIDWQDFIDNVEQQVKETA